MVAGQPENRNFLSPTGFKFTLKRTPKVKSGIFAELQKNATLGLFFKVNLNPVGDKKFLFSI